MPTLLLLPIIPGLWLAFKAWRTGLPIILRVPLMLLPLVISQIYNIQHSLFGSIAGPDVPAWILKLQIWAFMAMILVFLASLLWDLGTILVRLARFFGRGTSRQACSTRTAASHKPASHQTGAAASVSSGTDAPKPVRAKAAASAPKASGPADRPVLTRRGFLAGATACSMGLFVPAGALVSGLGVSSATAAPALHPWDVFVPDLPDELDGLRLVHLADLHLGPLSRRNNLASLVCSINDAEPDLVCLSGDLADGSPAWRCADATPRGSLAKELSFLRSRFGTFACTGNHEYYSSYSQWMRLWKEQGIHFLRNDHVVLPVKNGASLVLGGLDDPVGGVRTSSTSAFARAPEDRTRTFRVLLDHRPGAAAANARTGAQLQLSGHTHGGQCLGLSQVIARANAGFVRGWYTPEGMPLYVTSGAALWSGFAMRLGVPSEAALICLHKGPALRFCERPCFRSEPPKEA